MGSSASFKLVSGNKHCYKKCKDSLYIITYKGLIVLNANGEIITKTEPFDHYTSKDLTHGKEFEIIDFEFNSIIKTEYGIVALNNRFPYISDFYSATPHLDYDSEKLAFFEITPHTFKLHIYWY